MTQAQCFRGMGLCLSLVAFAVVPQTFAQDKQTTKPSVNLSGVYQLSGGGGGGSGAFKNFPQSEWSAEKLPFTQQGLEIFLSNKPGKGPRQIKPALGNDPLGGANPPGLYRTLVYSRPFEIVQLPDKILQVFEWGRIWRAIYTDGRPVPADIPAGPYWYGYSVGKWEGDTLVVTTLGLDDRAWMDEWGTPLDGEARIEERWQRIAPNKIQMTITVNDPVTYAKPWTSSPMTYALQKKGVEPQEIIFAPMDESAFNESIRDPAGLPK